MRRKLLTMLSVLCMALAIVPNATKANDEEMVFAHGEWIELPQIDELPMTFDDEDTIVIETQDEFFALGPSEWRTGKTIKLQCDIDLSEWEDRDITEWDGYFDYLDGHLVGDKQALGRYPIIEGFENNTYLFYGMIRGSIENIEFRYQNNAGTIYFLPTTYTNPSYGDDYYEISIRNVNTTGQVSLTDSSQSNYSTFVYAANKGPFEMYNCVNYTDITGDVYGSIFHGYKILNTQATYKFEECRNEGDIKLRNAAMFFGNPTGVNTALANGTSVQIIGCENNGIISGTISQHYFAPSLNGPNFPTGETTLIQKEADIASTMLGKGQLVTAQNNGLEGEVNDDNTITFSYTGTETPTKFIVTVGSYVQRYVGSVYDGNVRYVVNEEIAYTENGSYTASLKYLGACDEDFGSIGISVAEHDTCMDSNGNLYYVIYSDESGVELYATTAKGNSNTDPSFASVSAVKVNSDGSETVIAFDTLR